MKNDWKRGLLALLPALALTACAGPAAENTPTAAPSPSPADWRETAAIAARDTVTLNGEEAAVCLLLEDGQALLYRDSPEQELVAQANYPLTLEGAAGAFDSFQVEDLDGDGSSDLTVNFAFPDGTGASFLWFWTQGEGYVLNEEFSRLPGETAK